MSFRHASNRPRTIVLLAGAMLAAAASHAAESAPIGYAYSTGSQTAQSVKVKARQAQVNFSAERPKRPPVAPPDETILIVPGFDHLRAPGPALRTPLGPETRAGARPAAGGKIAVGPAAAGDFAAFVTSSLAGLGNKSQTAPEPSVAVHDQIVFVTGNWYAALSTNNGVTFSYVDPYTTFPSVNGGFCCDQVALHEPSRDLLVWGLQYVQDAGGNTFRLAAAAGAANQASGSFNYWDFSAQFFGYPAGYILDFPNIGYGSNKLYFATNVFTGGGSYAATLVARMSLDEIAAGGVLHLNYAAQAVFSYKIAQGIGTTAYFASHSATNNVRILRWDEASTTLFWDDVGVTSFQNRGGVCPDPGGNNWCGFADIRVGAAWRTNQGGGQIGLMWNSAQGGPFSLPYPYVQVAVLRESDRALLSEAEIWSPGTAWQYPSSGVNGRGDLGGVIAYGGGPYYVSTTAWVWDDFNSHTFAPLENYGLAQGAASNGIARWGDFLTTWAHSHFTNSWVTVGVAPDAFGASQETYFWLGRRRDLPPASANDFYTVTPCRLVDTRRPAGTWGGPVLAGGGAERSFPASGQCGVPIDAAAIAVNVTIVQPTGLGDLRLFPTGIALPLVSLINYAPGQVRANNAVLSLAGNPLGSFTVHTDMAPGSVHFIVDVSGYFR